MRTNLQIVVDHYVASARLDFAGMMAEVSPDVAWIEMAGFPARAPGSVLTRSLPTSSQCLAANRTKCKRSFSIQSRYLIAPSVLQRTTSNIW